MAMMSEPSAAEPACLHSVTQIARSTLRPKTSGDRAFGLVKYHVETASATTIWPSATMNSELQKKQKSRYSAAYFWSCEYANDLVVIVMPSSPNDTSCVSTVADDAR